MNTKLRKAVRTFRRMLNRLRPSDQRNEQWEETRKYLNALYAEFGRQAVEAEIERQRS